jgi:hypothetical protein
MDKTEFNVRVLSDSRICQTLEVKIYVSSIFKEICLPHIGNLTHICKESTVLEEIFNNII